MKLAILLAATSLSLATAHRLSFEHHKHLALAKRDFSGRATFWDVEDSEVACGGYYKHTQAVVALNFQQYGNPNSRSSFCGETVLISYKGKSKKAVIVDACEGCGYGGLDMSTSLFNFFEDPDAGIFHMSWSVVGSDDGDDGSDDGDDDPTTTSKKTSSKATPTTTSKKTSTYYKPTSTSKKPTTTSTPDTPDPTSTPASTTTYSSSSSVISSSVNSTISTSGTVNGTVSETSTGKTGKASSTAGSGGSGASFDFDGGVLNTVNQVVLGFAGLTAQIAIEGSK